MDLSKLGGDSQNTTPIAIQAGLQARQIAKLTPVAPDAAKFSVDAFKKAIANPGAIKDAAVANLPLADALQQQGFVSRMLSRIPFVKNFMGASGEMNGLIGGLGKTVNKTELTQKLLSAKNVNEVAKIVQGAGIADDATKAALTAAAEKAVAERVGQTLVTEVGQAAVKGGATVAAETAVASLADDAIKGALALTKSGIKDPKVVQEILKKGLTGDALKLALTEAGTSVTAAKAIVRQVSTSTVETTVKAAGTEVAQKITQTTTTEVTKETAKKAAGGIKGFFGKLLSGAKGNFIVAGVFSLASNAIQLAQGKMSIKQFVGLTVLDTAAYGAIGWGSAAAGAAIGTALFPGIGSIAGFVIGLGIGLVGGMAYEKVVRNPVKNMLGGPAAGGATPGAYNPGAYNTTAPAADPYAAQAPAGPGTAAAPYTGGDVSYEQAMAQIDRMGR